jgi:hypothetical protein
LVLCEPCHRRHHNGRWSDPATARWARENPWLGRVLGHLSDDGRLPRGRSEDDLIF